MTYNPPLRASTLEIARYGVPGNVIDQFVADRVRDMTEEILNSRRKVTYQSVNDWADNLSSFWNAG